MPTYPLSGNAANYGLGSVGGGTEAPARVRAFVTIAADPSVGSPSAAQYAASIWDYPSADPSAIAATSQIPGSMVRGIGTAAGEVWFADDAGTLVKVIDNGIITATVSLASPLLASNGTVGAPSISFANSATTGFYRSAANTIGIAVSGALDFSISANSLNVLSGSSIAMAASTTIAWASDVITSTATVASWTHSGAGDLTINNSDTTHFTVFKGGTADSATGIKVTTSADGLTHSLLNDGSATHTGRMTSAGVTNTGTMILGTRNTQDIATGNTITLPTGGISKRVTASGGAATGVILAAGVDQQQIVLYNADAANDITMAIAGTSHVANGTGCVLTHLTSKRFVYDGTDAVWYPG